MFSKMLRDREGNFWWVTQRVCLCRYCTVPACGQKVYRCLVESILWDSSIAEKFKGLRVADLCEGDHILGESSLFPWPGYELSKVFFAAQRVQPDAQEFEQNITEALRRLGATWTQAG